MKTLPLILAITALILTGCAQTQTIVLEEASGSSFAAINKRGAKKKANLLLSDGEKRLGVRNLQVSADSASWFTRSGNLEQVATADVYAINLEADRLPGFVPVLAGALIGGVVGRSGGYRNGLKQGDDPPVNCSWNNLIEALVCSAVKSVWKSAEDKARIRARWGMRVGVVVGTGLGFLTHAAMKYRKDPFESVVIPPPSKQPVAATFYPPHRRAALVPHRKR